MALSLGLSPGEPVPER